MSEAPGPEGAVAWTRNATVECLPSAYARNGVRVTKEECPISAQDRRLCIEFQRAMNTDHVGLISTQLSQQLRVYLVFRPWYFFSWAINWSSAIIASINFGP